MKHLNAIIVLFFVILFTATSCETDVDDIYDWPDHWNTSVDDELIINSTEKIDFTTLSIEEFRSIAKRKCSDETECLSSKTGLECYDGQCQCPETMRVVGSSCKPETFCKEDADCPHSWCDVKNQTCHEVLTIKMVIVFVFLAVTLGVVFLLFFIHRRVRQKRLEETTARTALVNQTPVPPVSSLFGHGFAPNSPTMTATIIPVRV